MVFIACKDDLSGFACFFLSKRKEIVKESTEYAENHYLCTQIINR